MLDTLFRASIFSLFPVSSILGRSWSTAWKLDSRTNSVKWKDTVLGKSRGSGNSSFLRIDFPKYSHCWCYFDNCDNDYFSVYLCSQNWGSISFSQHTKFYDKIIMFYYSCLCALSVFQLLKDDLYLITLSNENSIVGRSATEMLWQDAPKYRHSRYCYQLGCSVVQMSAGLQQ